MKQADSLLSAAKQVAEFAGLSWSEVQPYYRDLQQEPAYSPAGEQISPSNWLPKSQGRNVWAAHPNYISRLLLALAGTSQPSEARAAVEWTRDLTPEGRALYITELPAAGVPAPIEAELFRYLVDPKTADDLIHIEVQRDTQRVIIVTKSAAEPIVYRSAGSDADVLPKLSRLIYTRGVIDGEVFRKLASSVKWRAYDEGPLKKVQQGQVGEDD
ncbi:hypothetical protein AB4Y85_18150 [Microvirga sp. 2YAF29]|uniref:hypothetical protein n=1 Tax=Microvirga sp. 2YAF29 TaxID=3233031 RepID=UPI003F9DD2BA